MPVLTLPHPPKRLAKRSSRSPKGEKRWLDDPDVLLMLRVRDGDEEAFRELTDRYGARIFGFFRGRLGDRQEAEDLTQDVLLRLFRSRQRYEPRARFSTWIFHITSPADNAKRFKEFLGLEIPAARPGGLQLNLFDARAGKTREYSLADLVYAIRCMTHENENLNAAENPDYHILLDWSPPGQYSGVIKDGRITLNGHFIWRRLREVMAKFITVIDGRIAFAQGADRVVITIQPPLGSVRPKQRRDG